MTSRKFEVIVNGKTLCLDETDILYIAPGDIHAFDGNNNKGLRTFIQFDPVKLGGLGAEALKPFSVKTRLLSKNECSTVHRNLEYQIQKLTEEYSRKGFAYQYALNARLFDLVTILLRSCPDNKLLKSQSMNSKKLYGLEKLNKALEYIEKNYTQDITLDKISNAAGFSTCHFSRIFNEIMEMNFNSYLNELRIKKAEKLLMDSEQSIAQIALMTGFNSFTTFNRAFRKVKGCSPTAYRKFKHPHQ